MAPEFFVPRPDGTHLDADKAERAYQSTRKEAEQGGRPALDGRVYRLRFVHSEYRRELVAEVGELDPYGYKRRVAAIVAFSDHYWICTPAPNHIVGSGDERVVEHFT